MADVKLEDLVGEIAAPTTPFSVKPYLEDFFGGIIVGITVPLLTKYFPSLFMSEFSMFKSSPPDFSPLSTGYNIFFSAVLTGLSAIPPFRKAYDKEHLETNQNIWGGRFTRFAGVFTGLSYISYLLR